MKELIESEKELFLKRLSMWLPRRIHNEINCLAHNRNITITKWVTRAIIQAIRNEKKYE